MITFHTPKGRAGSDQLDAIEESVNAHLEQMFQQKAKRDILTYGVGRTTMKFQDSGIGRLEAQKRECDGQMVFHAGQALELSMQIVYARGKDRIMGRGYPGVVKKELNKDLSSHKLLKLYERVLEELDKPDLDKAFEEKYQRALHKGVTDIYVDRSLVSSILSQDQWPFMERSVIRMSDGEEHTMDHSTTNNLFTHPDETSDFAQMSCETFKEFLKKADAVYYEDDEPGRGIRRNMRWASYAARDHEIGRPYVIIGTYFFARLVQGIIELGQEPWIWHEDFLQRSLDRRRYNIMEKLKILAKQNLKGEVAWPEMISENKMREAYFVHPDARPVVGQGNYDFLHTKLEFNTRPTVSK